MSITRKDFLWTLIGLSAAAAVAACTDAGESPAPDAGGPSCTANGAAAAIGTNHGHTLAVSKEDVAAGADRTYQIQGSSGHGHTVAVTAAMFATLKGGGSVSATSSNDAGHTHAVTLTCA
jgi:hypothetical protein